MSTRLAKGGRLIDRATTHRFTFNGRQMKGYSGDTLASALLAGDQMLVGRSFKYHRPRGIVASGAEEPNALVGLGSGNTFEPNQRVTVTELFDGLEAQSQNHWPSLEFDVGAINAKLSRFLPAGFYYKTFIHPRPFWKHVYEPFIRKSAGLGKAPDKEARDPDTYEHFYAHVDVLVIGGGVAGLQAAKVAAQSGGKVLLIEQNAHWGGRAPVDGGTVDGAEADAWVSATLKELEGMANVTMRTRTMGAGLYDHGYATAYERVSDHAPGSDAPRHRLWRIRAGQIVTATGAIERPLSFAGNDIPGVMLASAARDFAVNYAVSPGDRTVVVTNNDDAYRTALALKSVGLSVPAVIDARANGGGALMAEAEAQGIRVLKGKGIAKVQGGARVTGVEICPQAGEGATQETIACDAVAMSGGWSPVVHLWSHIGGKLTWDETENFFRPDPERAPITHDGSAIVTAVGAANGHLGLSEIVSDATSGTTSALKRIGLSVDAAAPEASPRDEAPMEPVWLMPQGAKRALRAKAWLDFQNDVKVTDVQLAAQEGYVSVEHTKRYTTLGMATDQGKLSNINGLAILSQALGEGIPQVGTTTFRPPYTPISLASIAGEAKGELFQPIRRTALHSWHEENGAEWEPVGHWRRPFAYRKPGESTHDAVTRECVATRESLGLLDASTLGKILVKGPDAGRFMDMLYTNMMSSLKPGFCRYGLMCSENGFLMDDGVVARIDEDTFLCHTTTGGAERIHAHMEEWLQTEWWDWKVWVLNVTEQYTQIGVVGPKSRAVLEKLGTEGIGKDELPFMRWIDGNVGGIPARIFRISFSGELSFEIAVAANRGRELWDKLIEAGQEFNVTPYGTEAMHVLRAEKGFIMIGEETDGTIIPQDLGLHWAISKKKEDYIGKRAQERSFMDNPERWQLVGLETTDGSKLPDGAYAVAPGNNANGQVNTQGRVTSSYHSAALGRPIAMGLVHNGPDRMGEVIEFAMTDGSRVPAKITGTIFFDPEGEKQNV